MDAETPVLDDLCIVGANVIFSDSSSCAYSQKLQKLLICVDTQIPNSDVELFCVWSHKLHREVVCTYPQKLRKFFICVHMQKLCPVRGVICESPHNFHRGEICVYPQKLQKILIGVHTQKLRPVRGACICPKFRKFHRGEIYAHGSNMEFLRLYSEFLSFLILEILQTYAE